MSRNGTSTKNGSKAPTPKTKLTTAVAATACRSADDGSHPAIYIPARGPDPDPASPHQMTVVWPDGGAFQIDLGGGKGSVTTDRSCLEMLVRSILDARLLHAYVRMSLKNHDIARAFDSGDWDFMLLVSRRTGDVVQVGMR